MRRPILDGMFGNVDATLVAEFFATSRVAQGSPTKDEIKESVLPPPDSANIIAAQGTVMKNGTGVQHMGYSRFKSLKGSDDIRMASVGTFIIVERMRFHELIQVQAIFDFVLHL